LRTLGDTSHASFQDYLFASYQVCAVLLWLCKVLLHDS